MAPSGLWPSSPKLFHRRRIFLRSHANQPDFSSQLQIQRLRQDLAHAQKRIQEYEDLIASLYTALHNVGNDICVDCRAHFEKHAPVGLATSSTAGAVIQVSPSSKPKFSLLRSSNSPRSSAPSNRVPFWHHVFKGHHTISLHSPSRPTNRSVFVSSESIQPSLSVTQQPISVPEASTSRKYSANQLDWSVDFDSHVKPALDVKLELVLTHAATVGTIKFSPDGKYFAVGVSNGRTYIYDVKTGVKSCFLADNSETRKLVICSLCFSPDGKYLAVGAFDEQLRIWEIAKKHTRNIFREHTDTIIDLDFSPDGRFLVSCSYDRTVYIWRMRDGFAKILKDKSASYFYCVKFNPDGRYIAAGNYDGILRIWNVRTSQLVEKWTVHRSVVRSVAFTKDGKGLVSGGDDTWKYWDISFLELAEPGYGMTRDSTAGQKSKVTAHTNDLRSISISPDGQWVASGSGDHTVCIRDLRNNALQCTLKGHKEFNGWLISVQQEIIWHQAVQMVG